MKISWSLVVGITGLVFMLWPGPSWGQLPSGNDISTNDGRENTGGGTDALKQNTVGQHNTAYGNGALEKNTEGVFNTAFGHLALQNTTQPLNSIFIGSANTAVGD